MIKQLLFTIACLLGAISLRAQTEPEKSPAQPDASRPPTLHDASHTPAQQNPPPAVATGAKTTEGAKPKIDKNPPAFDTKNMDKSVKPGDDFFRYANGGWIKRTPIPPEYARWGSFNELIEKITMLCTRSRKSRESCAEGSEQGKGRTSRVSRFAEGRRFLCERIGPEENQRRGREAVAGRAQTHRCDEGSERSRKRDWTSAQHGSPRAVWFHLWSGRQEQHDGDRAGVSRRSRHAGPRLLHEG